MREPQTYQEFAPRGSLGEFLSCVWTFTSPPDETPQPIAPDGRPELIIHCRKPYLERGAAMVQPSVLFAGQLTKPLTLVAVADVAVIGARFRPDGARAFLGFDVDVATDRRIDLTTLHGEAAVKLLQAAHQAEDMRVAAEVAQDYIARRLVGAQVDTPVREAVTRLLAGEGAPAPTAISERQFQRRFKSHVGVSPRTLQAILRFRSVFDAIERPETSTWVEAAFEAGYFDQPQMARDFRRFLGCTARQWAAQRAGLAQALTASGRVRDPVSVAYKKRERNQS